MCAAAAAKRKKKRKKKEMKKKEMKKKGKKKVYRSPNSLFDSWSLQRRRALLKLGNEADTL